MRDGVNLFAFVLFLALLPLTCKISRVADAWLDGKEAALRSDAGAP